MDVDNWVGVNLETKGGQVLARPSHYSCATTKSDDDNNHNNNNYRKKNVNFSYL